MYTTLPGRPRCETSQVHTHTHTHTRTHAHTYYTHMHTHHTHAHTWPQALHERWSGTDERTKQGNVVWKDMTKTAFVCVCVCTGGCLEFFMERYSNLHHLPPTVLPDKCTWPHQTGPQPGIIPALLGYITLVNSRYVTHTHTHTHTHTQCPPCARGC